MLPGRRTRSYCYSAGGAACCALSNHVRTSTIAPPAYGRILTIGIIFHFLFQHCYNAEAINVIAELFPGLPYDRTASWTVGHASIEDIRIFRQTVPQQQCTWDFKVLLQVEVHLQQCRLLAAVPDVKSPGTDGLKNISVSTRSSAGFRCSADISL